MPQKDSSSKKQKTRKGKGAGLKQPVHPRPGEKTSATVPPRKATVETVEHISTVITQLLETFRRAPSSLLPVKPLPPGTVSAELPIDRQSLQKLFAAAAIQDNPGSQIWVKDNSELLVFTGQVKLDLDDGFVLVTIPVSCEQSASAIVQVPFAVGGKGQPAGMLFATEDRPRGPAVIVDVWGEALAAFAWRLLVTVTSRVAAQAGVDEDGAGLIPIAITVTQDGLRLQPMARHTFDRVQP